MAGAVDVVRPRSSTFAPRALVEWFAAQRELIWLLTLLSVAVLVHTVNLFGFPYYENDEGTYLAQAWAVFHLGQIAPYTYWYDHPPLGWIQLGLLSPLVGGFVGFGNSIEAGRVSMLPFYLGSTFLLYRVARASGRTVAAASIAVLLFAFSAYELYYGRRVLLDNIAAFWLLASVLPLLSRRLTLSRVWLSAACLGIGILSKEIDIVFVPGMALLVATRVDRSRRLLAVSGWMALALAIASGWILLALLKGELFAAGTPLGGPGPHTSLLDALAFQASRARDGGLLQATSGFWGVALGWIAEDPILVVGGTIGAIVAVVGMRRAPATGALGVMVISAWLFLGRGGVTINYYLLPLIPLLALMAAWLVDAARSSVRWIAERVARRKGTRIRIAADGVIAVCLVAGTLAGYRDGGTDPGGDPTSAWTSTQAVGQRQAIDWIRRTLPPEASMATDMYLYLDLHDPPASQPRFDLAHYYWKVDQDPEIQTGVFGGRWRNVDYLIVTDQMFGDARTQDLPLVRAAIGHGDILASFGNGIFPVTVERGGWVQSWPAPGDQLLVRSWTEWKGDFLHAGRVVDPTQAEATPAGLQANALLQAVYMNDRPTFDALWAWTRANLQDRQGGLLASTWGVRPDGTGGVTSSAPSPGADTDLALALIFAADQWQEPSYGAAALSIVRAIWDHETAAAAGARLVVAGTSPAVRGAPALGLVDVSALAPYAYRTFAQVDPAHPWNSLVRGTYDLLAQVQSRSDLGAGGGVVPHWLAVDPRSGRPSLPTGALGKDDLFDAAASQLGWRVGLDWLWNHDQRARQVLEGLSVAGRELATKSWLGLAYHLNGDPVNGQNSVATYATALPSMLFTGQAALACSTLTKDVLAPLVGSSPPDPADAAGRSWGWFAAALMDGSLVDLTRSARTVDWSRVPGLVPPSN